MGSAIVTGASSGIGAVFARELAKAGHKVIAVARRMDRLEALADEVESAGEGHIEPFEADLETTLGIEKLGARAVKLADLDLLVNNAGFGESGHYLDLDPGRELSCIRVNVEALVALTHRVLPGMVSRGRGGIINVASTIAFQPVPYFATYAATKAFVLSYSEGIAHELRGTGVKITCVCPGPVKTEFALVSKNDKFQNSIPNLTPERVVRDSLRAWEQGKVVKVIGGMNQVLALVNSVAPRGFVRANMARFAKPESPPKSLPPRRATSQA